MNAGQDWEKSTIVFNAREKTTSRRRGKWVMMEYQKVVEKFGQAVADDIRSKKKELQAARQEGEDDWYMDHPEVADEVRCFASVRHSRELDSLFFLVLRQAFALMRMWDSLEFTNEKEQSNEYSLHHEGQVGEEHGKAIMPLIVREVGHLV